MFLRSYPKCRPRVVVCGTGWGGSTFLRNIDPSLCELSVLSHRNHMIFTPLLPQSTTGSLELRSVCESIFTIQPQLCRSPHSFLYTSIQDVDFDKKVIISKTIKASYPSKSMTVKEEAIPYDKLILAHGAMPNTFSIPGVNEHTYFLRESSDALEIRAALLNNAMLAASPSTTDEEKRQLLHTVVVGGGPAGVEFAANLADFVKQDLPRIHPGLTRMSNITILEAMNILGPFDDSLRTKARQRLDELNVSVVKEAVSKVEVNQVTTSTGKVIPCGLIIWSTGVCPVPLTTALKTDKNRGRIAINDLLCVLKDDKPIEGVYAIGDCAANTKNPLPTLAAVAVQQASFLAKEFNESILVGKHRIRNSFAFNQRGTMISLGDKCAVVDLKKPFQAKLSGFTAMLLYRCGYLRMLLSTRARLAVIFNWVKAKWLGRELSFITDPSTREKWLHAGLPSTSPTQK